MIADSYFLLALTVLIVHLAFNAWVVFGAVLTRDRPVLAGIHIVSVIYGAVMENVSWPCPLTIMENWAQAKAGLTPYQGPFLVHYISTFVSPNFPLVLLRVGAVAVCLVNLGIYAWRGTRQQRPA